MSLTRKIEQEIKNWEEKISLKKAQAQRMELEIKALKHLLQIAEKVEGVER